MKPTTCPVTTANYHDDVVVLLIGLRINSWWAIHQWLPVVMAMPAMIRELQADPDSGFLGASMAFGNPTIMVQYWRSMDDVLRYARDPQSMHVPAWRRFNQKVRGTGRVGVWHETYMVPASGYETVYVNMPPFGLGAIAGTRPAMGALRKPEGRMADVAQTPHRKAA